VEAEVTLAALAKEMAELRHELGILQDIQAVRTLQFKYGYYMDKGLYDEVVDLFADQGELHFMGGIFRGRAGLTRLYCGRLRSGFTDGNNGPVYGLLAEHLQLQDIVDIARTARARRAGSVPSCRVEAMSPRRRSTRVSLSSGGKPACMKTVM